MTILSGNNNNNTLTGDSNDNTILGLGGNDVLNGGAGNDAINGGAGNDKINGGSGNDTIDGGTGNDTIDGGSGNDLINGGAGVDNILGGTGNDVINGGDGNDTINAGPGSDIVSGGSGNDTVIYTVADAVTTELDLYSGDAGTDTLVIDLANSPLPAAYSTYDQYKNAIISYFASDNKDKTVDFRNMTNGSLQLVAKQFETIVVKVPPVVIDKFPLAREDTFSTNEDTPLTINFADLLFNDLQGDGSSQVFGLNMTGLEGTLTNVGTGYKFVPNADFNGTTSFKYTIYDADGDISTATVTINVISVNDAPVAAGNTAAVDKNTQLVLDAGDLLANDTDLEEDDLHITGVSTAENGSVSYDSALDEVTFIPNPGYFGPASFKYFIDDGHGGTAEATVNITINNVNELVANDDAFSTNEDIPLTINFADLTDNDTGGDGSISIFSVDTSGMIGTLELTPSGYKYTPPSNFSGSESFTYTSKDDDGDQSLPATVTITVNAVNDAPVAAGNTAVVDKNTQLVLDAGDLLANDTDLEEDDLHITGVSTAENGSVSYDSALDEVTFIPNPGYFGPASFKYFIDDGHGGTAEATVNITINNVDKHPVANTDTFSTDEDTPLQINLDSLISNDVLGDGIHMIVNVDTAGLVGTLSPNGLYTPPSDFNGTTSFNYTISDGDGDESTATVTITVNSVNDIPIVTDDLFETAEDTALILNIADLLSNDSDGDGDALSLVSIEGGEGVNGTATVISSTQIEFMPAKDFNGEFSFNYTVEDSDHAQKSGTVTVNVLPANDPPIVINDRVETAEDTALIINIADLLSNDSDIDGNDFSLVSIGGGDGVNGTATPISGTQIEFIPRPNFNGEVSFTYTVEDSFGAQTEGTVTVNVTPVNDLPVVNHDFVGTAADTPLIINLADLLNNDSDIDGDDLSVISIGDGDGVNGTATLINSTQIEFIPRPGFNGEVSFTYTVEDSSGAQNEATVTVHVLPVDDLPYVLFSGGIVTVNSSITEAPPISYASGTLSITFNNIIYNIPGATQLNIGSTSLMLEPINIADLIAPISVETLFTGSFTYTDPTDFEVKTIEFNEVTATQLSAITGILVIGTPTLTTMPPLASYSYGPPDTNTQAGTSEAEVLGFYGAGNSNELYLLDPNGGNDILIANDQIKENFFIDLRDYSGLDNNIITIQNFDLVNDRIMPAVNSDYPAMFLPKEMYGADNTALDIDMIAYGKMILEKAMLAAETDMNDGYDAKIESITSSDNDVVVQLGLYYNPYSTQDPITYVNIVLDEILVDGVTTLEDVIETLKLNFATPLDSSNENPNAFAETMEKYQEFITKNTGIIETPFTSVNLGSAENPNYNVTPDSTLQGFFNLDFD